MVIKIKIKIFQTFASPSTISDMLSIANNFNCLGITSSAAHVAMIVLRFGAVIVQITSSYTQIENVTHVSKVDETKPCNILYESQSQHSILESGKRPL